jgi:hypothetical protein
MVNGLAGLTSRVEALEAGRAAGVPPGWFATSPVTVGGQRAAMEEARSLLAGGAARGARAGVSFASPAASTLPAAPAAQGLVLTD